MSGPAGACPFCGGANPACPECQLRAIEQRAAKRGGKREGAGRKTLSSEKRARVNWTITPTAEARVVAAAADAGVSPSELVERWAMSLPTPASTPTDTASPAR